MQGTGWSGTGAVSYTHLDVYKRQGYEMDQEEIELLKNTNNRFRRK